MVENIHLRRSQVAQDVLFVSMVLQEKERYNSQRGTDFVTRHEEHDLTYKSNAHRESVSGRWGFSLGSKSTLPWSAGWFCTVDFWI